MGLVDGAGFLRGPKCMDECEKSFESGAKMSPLHSQFNQRMSLNPL